MIKKIEDKLRSRKVKLILAFILAALAVGMIWGSNYLLETTPQWLNKTDAQQYADFGKAVSQMAQACRDAGGSWRAGFADAGCTVQF